MSFVILFSGNMKGGFSMTFNDIGNGKSEGFVLLSKCEERTSKNGSSYLDLTVSDKSGEMPAKLFDYDARRFGTYAAGDAVKIRGTVSAYNGTDQFKIDNIRHIEDSDNCRINDLVPSVKYDGKEMYDALISIADSFEDTDLKNIVKTIYEEHKDALYTWPAAQRFHHAARGGLLFHTLSIVRDCENAAKVYPNTDRELLISGAMLHDIGKIYEIETSEQTGLACGYSVQGNLLGHITIGVMLVDSTGKRIGTDPEKLMLLEHMILSHHGRPEYGSAVQPAFLEAEILSQFDMLDADIYEITQAVSETENGCLSARLFALDGRKFYSNGKKGKVPDADLI
jgi:3'-5' exoribonuclease